MDDGPLCLLALDGGGIRGLSELVVLGEIMNRIKHDLDSDEDLLPADFFDLIGGTSTGGLIALLLGRLRRSVPQARREYIRIAEDVFSLPRYLKKSTFDARKLEEAVKRLLGNSRSEEKMVDKNGSCKVFVCAVPQQDMRARAGPRLFRTYKVRENASFNCTIWEACRATSAAPSYFEPIKIGDEGEQETFVDGGLGYNNPVEQVLEEAGRTFPGRKVACVVSIGTGVASVIKFPDAPKTNPIKLIKALTDMATESDTMAEKMQRRFQNAKDMYFRFSVDRGLQGIGLEEWKELPKVGTFTTEYLHQRTVSEHVNKVVEALLASKVSAQDGSSTLIQLLTIPSVNSENQRASRTLQWRPTANPLPTFSYTAEQLASHIVSNSDQTIKGHFLAPFGRNQGFIGRARILSQLQEMIWPGTNKDDCQRIAIEGLGGVGKTQIALEAVYRVRDEHPGCSIFWVSAIDAASFENAYYDIGKLMKVDGIDGDKADVKLLVKHALEMDTTSSWLLVIDNADDLDLLFGSANLSDYLPFSRMGSILFTTRNHKVATRLDIPWRDIFAVEEMDDDEALDLLQTGLEKSQSSDTKSTSRLLNILANLPLAIRQASAYMAENKTQASDYLELCETDVKGMVELLSKDFDDRHRYKDIQNPIATTWLISFRHISKHNWLAAKYLKFMSLLAEKSIPKALLPSARKVDAIEAIGTLKAYAFIVQRVEQDSFDMHRLVRLAMQNLLQDKGELARCLRSAIEQLDRAFPSPKHENKGLWTTYLPHAQSALEFREHFTNQKAEAHLASKVGKSHYILGQYHMAEPKYRQALHYYEKLLGKEHPDTMTSMNELANVLTNIGKYKEAEQMYRHTLELRDKVLGKKHKDTLASMNNLANMLACLSKHKEAEQMLRQALELLKKVLGNEHPHTLTSMNNLANVLACLSKHKEAEQMLRQTLDLRKKVLGEEHPDTLASINNLANVLIDQSKHEEAEQMYRQTLKLLEKVLGKEHPDTLASMNNLALFLNKLGKHKEAEQMHQQTLELREKVLGQEHPGTLTSMDNLANVLNSLGKHKEAEQMHQQTLELRKKVLGKEHPETQKSQDNFANCTLVKTM